MTTISPSSLLPPIMTWPHPSSHHHPIITHRPISPTLSDALQAALKATRGRCIRPSSHVRPSSCKAAETTEPRPLLGLFQGLLGKPASCLTSPYLPYPPAPPRSRPVSGFLYTVLFRRPSSHLDLHLHRCRCCRRCRGRLVISVCYCRRCRHGENTQPLVLPRWHVFRPESKDDDDDDDDDGGRDGRGNSTPRHDLHCGSPICPAWSPCG